MGDRKMSSLVLILGIALIGAFFILKKSETSKVEEIKASIKQDIKDEVKAECGPAQTTNSEQSEHIAVLEEKVATLENQLQSNIAQFVETRNKADVVQQTLLARIEAITKASKSRPPALPQVVTFKMDKPFEFKPLEVRLVKVKKTPTATKTKTK